MAKSSGTAGLYQRLMPITNKNIGKAHPHEKRGYRSRTYNPLNALQPISPDDSRQVARRKVIVQRKSKGFRLITGLPWRKSGSAYNPGGKPTPARKPRPKAHRWLGA